MVRNRTKSYSMDMCSGPILPKLLRFTVPLICSSMLQLLFNTADIIVVGRFAGENSLAAVGSTSSLINLLVNLFMGLSVGANILAAKHFGGKDDKALHETVHTAMALSLISGLAVTMVGLFGARWILVLMQSPPEVLELAVLYLRIYFLGMTATMLYNFGAALLRAVGDTQRPLYYLTLSGVVNVVLNLVFVIVFHMDVAGVALATVIAQCISAVLVVRCLIRETGAIHLDLRKLKIYAVPLKQILRVGLPAGLQGVLFSLSNVVIQSSINTFGEMVVAGTSAASSVENFLYIAMNSIHHATISFTSQNYGAGQYKRIRRIFFIAEGCVIVVGLTMGGLLLRFATTVLKLYTTNPFVVTHALVRMRILCATYFLCGMMDVAVGLLRGVGQSVLPMLVSLVGVCGLRLLWVATIFQIPQFHTINTVYTAYPISWAVTAIVHFISVYFVLKQVKKQFES
ncbi:MAG: MATE family efflux transporter [Oscillibacter sp.]|nr:MATE family efflux transporter [Oscillibacter sp.]